MISSRLCNDSLWDSHVGNWPYTLRELTPVLATKDTLIVGLHAMKDSVIACIVLLSLGLSAAAAVSLCLYSPLSASQPR